MTCEVVSACETIDSGILGIWASQVDSKRFSENYSVANSDFRKIVFFFGTLLILDFYSEVFQILMDFFFCWHSDIHISNV